MDHGFLEMLACPVHGTGLAIAGNILSCPDGCSYPVIGDVPFLLSKALSHSDEPWAQGSFRLADAILQGKESLPPVPGPGVVDAHVQEHIAGTNSAMYRSLVGHLARYPIPDFPLVSQASGELLLDIGCHWGRWCFAADHAGFFPVGIDPCLSGVLAAARIAKQLSINAYFVCGDSRHMPFKNGTFDAAFSFSVLQHLSKTDVAQVVASLKPVMKNGGVTKLHMLNRYGLRSLQVQLFRLFMKPFFFETRYWSPGEMLSTFSTLGPSRLEVDGFFVQGRFEDRHLFPFGARMLTIFSHWLKRASGHLRFLRPLADNLFVVSKIR
jgi:SAM-dependent methyltransferase/uncharacterized protein YbaR (Trm112 family)